MHVTVKIPVMTDKLTKKKLTLLERLTGRDTTVIKRYLTILTTEQNKLWQEGDEREKIDCGKLDALTLTSRPSHRKNKNTGKIVRNPGRPMVTYDLKHEFHDKITVRELKECRDMAVEMFQSYLTCIQEH